ncbi:hypothetical protein [Kitasatospora sp. McL0602]|uniref:hypothetical protein n=1 Tax=Kitasatospora sp. McL0602 TaxID=3439530 RepID=UPI003F89D6B3
MTSTARADLQHIADNWATLREQLQTTTPRTWPPAMGLHHHLDDDEQAELDAQAAIERAERTALAPGVRPAPLRVAVLDTITAIEDELLALADEIASSVQRPAFTVRAASPLDEVARSVALIGLKDAQNPARWRFNLAHRDGAIAAAWLAARLDGPAGPFRALNDDQQQRIASTAAVARRRLDRTLGETGDDDSPVVLSQVCECGGHLEVRTGIGDFVIRCAGCGTSWDGSALIGGITAA